MIQSFEMLLVALSAGLVVLVLGILHGTAAAGPGEQAPPIDRNAPTTIQTATFGLG